MEGMATYLGQSFGTVSYVLFTVGNHQLHPTIRFVNRVIRIREGVSNLHPSIQSNHLPGHILGNTDQKN